MPRWHRTLVFFGFPLYTRRHIKSSFLLISKGRMTYCSYKPESSPHNNFNVQVLLKLYSLSCEPKHCEEIRKLLGKHVLKGSQIKNIQVEEGGKRRKLLLRYLTEPPAEGILEDFQQVSSEFIEKEKELREYLYRIVSEGTTENSIGLQYLKQLLRNSELESYEFSYDIRKWPLNKILRRLVPELVSWPSSFETVGSIIHLNLRDDLLPYKFLIGNILLTKHYPRIKTVVNKTGETSGPFRTFDMEVLCGDANLITEVKENGCVYELDYERVYWNSKLEAERRRVIETFSSSDIIADAFAGVGPFVIPAAKHKGCVAFGNDLNPISTEYLSKNIRRNNVSNLVRASCLDACTFVKRLIDEEIFFTKLIMNYPSSSTEFLHVLKGLYKSRENAPLPIVYCYIFGRGPDPFKDALFSVFQGLVGTTSPAFDTSAFQVRLVRDVAPEKFHMLVEFELPAQVAYAQKT
ncbi:hypothetical protein GpartN1_g1100.t1 [Galdieria partita]|uniref:tRNA (guanine(37)-N1)-methyltransferase n=1 Tax=Galdieria partita TaxID=83374 RepID=A0A9C7UN05_9RHOD|nr:hypothetical protein GpartN1_g1100.t1 [Galdieria partita]